jgi:serine/threonine protein kinase
MALEDIPGYSLRRGLGSGSAGAVWLVRDLGSGRHAVLKRLPTAAVADPVEFRRQLALAQDLRHPHVARLLEVRRTSREWLLFSQYVAAGTVTDLLERRGPLSLPELVTLVTPLAQALGALHRVGLTHGHLGTGDVMFDADGRPILTDVGLRLCSAPTGPTEPSADREDVRSVRRVFPSGRRASRPVLRRGCSRLTPGPMWMMSGALTLATVWRPVVLTPAVVGTRRAAPIPGTAWTMRAVPTRGTEWAIVASPALRAGSTGLTLPLLRTVLDPRPVFPRPPVRMRL